MAERRGRRLYLKRAGAARDGTESDSDRDAGDGRRSGDGLQAVDGHAQIARGLRVDDRERLEVRAQRLQRARERFGLLRGAGCSRAAAARGDGEQNGERTKEARRVAACDGIRIPFRAGRWHAERYIVPRLYAVRRFPRFDLRSSVNATKRSARR